MDKTGRLMTGAPESIGVACESGWMNVRHSFSGSNISSSMCILLQLVRFS